MMNAKIQDTFNSQIAEELYSANLYLAMSAYAESKGFVGFGKWLREQYREELEHASKLIDQLIVRGGEVVVPAVAAPAREFGSMQQLFESVLTHERKITAAIHSFYALAGAEKDTATQVFLQWFVNEQVEEEANAFSLLERLRMVGDRTSSVLYLDKEAGKRQKRS